MADGRDHLVLQNPWKNGTRDKVRHRRSKSAREQQVCELCRGQWSILWALVQLLASVRIWLPE